jgi:hypothetical protein
MKPKDVEDRIEMLEYAREYLKRNDLDRQWSLVDQDYYLFTQLVLNRKKLAGASQKSVFESLSYSILTTSKKSDEVEGRLYAVIPDVRKHLSAIVDEIKIEFPAIIEDQPSSDDDSDLLLENTGLYQDPLIQIATELIDISTEKQIKVAEIIQTVISDEKAKEKERKSTNYLLDQVKKAATALTSAVNACNEDNVETGSLDEYLDSIIANVEQLKNWLLEHEYNN